MESYVDKGKSEYRNGSVTNKTWGFGVWNASHTYAYNCNTIDEQKQFIKYYTIICNNLLCKQCQEHAKEYLKENPMEDYLIKTGGRDRDGDMLAMFEYTFKMHNRVNERLGKRIIPYGEIKKFYGDHIGVYQCTDTCMEGLNNNPYVVKEIKPTGFKKIEIKWENLFY